MEKLQDSFKQELLDMVENNILKYWMDKMVDVENGGFYGRRNGNDQLDTQAPKSAVLNGRILWAFSAAYRVIGKPEYLEIAQRAKDYILNYFIDAEYSGVYWTVDAHGRPLDTKKHTYAMAVILFALSEYVRSTGDGKVLESAKSLFYNIEGRTADSINSGYTEAVDRIWIPMVDQRLSETDEITDRTLNTHLHLLEAYTNLYRVWPNGVVGSRLRKLMGLILDKMVSPTTAHLGMFFTENWQGGKEIHSYGHSIETVWLMLDAAIAIGEPVLLRHLSVKIPRMMAAADEGLRPNGGMIYMSVKEGDSYRHIEDYHWWVQAESVVGHWMLYRHLGVQNALEVMKKNISFLKEYLVDWQQGEWFWSWNEKSGPNRNDDKAGMWKDPYHNTRMCLQIIEDLK